MGRFKVGSGFKDLVGNKYGLLTVVSYVGKDKHNRSKWSCLCECGNTHDAFGSDMKVGTAKCCGCTMTKKRPTRVTKDEFLIRAYKVHNTKYDYSSIVYKNTTTPIEIVCRSHGSFFQTPTQHYMCGQGCPKCAWESKAQQRRLTTETFILEAVKRNSGDYDYSLVNYVDNRTKVSISCNTCKHVFIQSPDSHLSGSGCPECARSNKSINYTLSNEDYVERAVQVHGTENYSYAHLNYSHCKSTISILCNSCGNVFNKRADVHLAGHGCPCKTTHGFNFTKRGILYVLSCGDMTKIGITSSSAEKRANEIGKDFGAEFTVVKSIEIKDPFICSNVETILLREMRALYSQPSAKFDGYTECFFSVDRKKLYTRMEQLIGELIES